MKVNYAYKEDHLEVVNYLYETCNADVETKDNDGNTPVNNAFKK